MALSEVVAAYIKRYGGAITARTSIFWVVVSRDHAGGMNRACEIESKARKKIYGPLELFGESTPNKLTSTNGCFSFIK